MRVVSDASGPNPVEGERALKEIEVIGNVDGFGWPARRESIPGRFSNG